MIVSRNRTKAESRCAHGQFYPSGIWTPSERSKLSSGAPNRAVPSGIYCEIRIHSGTKCGLKALVKNGRFILINVWVQKYDENSNICQNIITVLH